MLASSREKLLNYAETWKRKKRAGVREKGHEMDVKIKIFFYNCTKLAYMHLISWNCILTYFFLSHSLKNLLLSSSSSLYAFIPTKRAKEWKIPEEIYSILRRCCGACERTWVNEEHRAVWVQRSGLNYFHFFDNKFFFGVEVERKISRKSSRELGRVKNMKKKVHVVEYVWEKKMCSQKKCSLRKLLEWVENAGWNFFRRLIQCIHKDIKLNLMIREI